MSTGCKIPRAPTLNKKPCKNNSKRLKDKQLLPLLMPKDQKLCNGEMLLSLMKLLELLLETTKNKTTDF